MKKYLNSLRTSATLYLPLPAQGADLNVSKTGSITMLPPYGKILHLNYVYWLKHKITHN